MRLLPATRCRFQRSHNEQGGIGSERADHVQSFATTARSRRYAEAADSWIVIKPYDMAHVNNLDVWHWILLDGCQTKSYASAVKDAASP